MGKKKFQDLTMKDNFMFAAIMMEPENCQAVLECILDIPISRVEVSYEKSIIYNPEYRGIRLDVIARDEESTRFSVEMQMAKRQLFKRARYYHSQIDMELLESGQEYETLSDCYVIFICDFDPVGERKYRYTKRDTFVEMPEYEYLDGSHTVFLSTKGENDSEVPETLVHFLKYVGASKLESEEHTEDGLVQKLQNSVKQIKASREMRSRYMLLEEMMKDEFKAGKLEGRLEGKLEGRLEGRRESIVGLLEKIAPVSQSIQDRLASVSDMEVLTKLFFVASDVASLEEFEEKLSEYAE